MSSVSVPKYPYFIVTGDFKDENNTWDMFVDYKTLAEEVYPDSIHKDSWYFADNYADGSIIPENIIVEQIPFELTWGIGGDGFFAYRHQYTKGDYAVYSRIFGTNSVAPHLLYYIYSKHLKLW